jgi:hypothetical protein
MMRPELYFLYGIPTMFLIVGLIAYGIARLDAYRHPRVPKQAKDEGAGRDARA